MSSVSARVTQRCWFPWPEGSRNDEMQGAWHREQLGKRLLTADGAPANTKPAPGVHTGGHACGPCSRLMGCPDSPVTDEETRLLLRGTEAGQSRGEAGAGVRAGSETTGPRTAAALFNRTRASRSTARVRAPLSQMLAGSSGKGSGCLDSENRRLPFPHAVSGRELPCRGWWGPRVRGRRTGSAFGPRF